MTMTFQAYRETLEETGKRVSALQERLDSGEFTDETLTEMSEAYGQYVLARSQDVELPVESAPVADEALVLAGSSS